MPRLKLLLLVFLLVVPLSADVPDAVADGKRLIDQKEFDPAIQRLQGAIPDAAAINAETERNQAFSAIHFYSALAFFNLSNEGKAREQLEEYFSFAGTGAKLDAAKFDARFIRLFENVKKRMPQDSQSRFDTVYPGYREFSTQAPRERPLSEWDLSPEFVYLATGDEKAAFKRLRDEADRVTFIEQFWGRREAAFRREFVSRVAFADYAFGTEEIRGSLTDRGEVFVLLGKPRVVTVKNLTRAEGATIVRSRGQIADGTVERWYYFRDQLPAAVPRAEVEFKFITQPGYGEKVLSRDIFPLKALDAARRQ